MTYDFREKLAEGEAHEATLDAYFSSWYEIAPVTMEEQRRGIDRVFYRKSDGRRYLVQYKSDTTAARTGNAFVETVSVDVSETAGWAYTCEADYLVYFIPPMGLAYVLKPSRIREKLPAWLEEYETRAAPNKGYRTVGVLVPLDEFEELCIGSPLCL